MPDAVSRAADRAQSPAESLSGVLMGTKPVT